MNFTDIFKGSYLVALIGAVIVCAVLTLFGVPAIAVYVVMFALGCNNKNFAEWIEDRVLSKLRDLFQ